uniref:Peptidase A1 domain-containing protein n=1 Tax=Chenopodium quinoa TaxID=63459 RepID=A0A803M3T4_CHEQI
MAKIQIFLLSLLINSLTLISPTLGALKQGFTTDLIHRDSPLSPLYNPSLDKWERVRKSIRRSFSRVSRYSLSSSVSPNDVVSEVKPARGEYLMEVYLGTPPVKQLGIVDTGSDLIWTQCQPCTQCFKQKLPIFNPRRSTTYKVQSCESKACQALDPNQGSCSRRDTCEYIYTYGDQSHTSGDVAAETFTFKSRNRGNTSSFPRISFGCGIDNSGTFSEEGSGLIGLGGGPLSLVSQLGSSIGGKFSYCLIPFAVEGNFTSKINFGTKGEVSGRGVVSTLLVQKSPETFYFLTLEGISIGNKRIPFSSSKRSSLSTNDYGSEEGNIIIDSGTTLTFLPEDTYSELSNSVKRIIRGTPVLDPSRTLDLCYQASRSLKLPNLTAHFTGADIQLRPDNTFINVSEDVVCFAFVPAQDISIFGNVAQANYLVEYDLEEGTVSFKPTDCTEGQ